MAKNKGSKAAQAEKPGANTKVENINTHDDKTTKYTQAAKANTEAKVKDVGGATVKGAATNGKKSKKVPIKEPTPESSSDEDDSADEGESSDSTEESAPDSESESESESDDASEANIKPAVAQTNGKANGKVNGATAKEQASSDSSESSESSESEDEATVPKSATTTSIVAAQTKSTSDEESSESESDKSAAEAEINGAADPKAAVSGGLKTSSSSSGSESEESGSGSESSDESSEEDAAPKKRKAEAESVPAPKKVKTETTAVTNGDADEQNNLFVGQLSWNIDDEWLKRTFEVFGEITGARVITDRESGKSRGFGYVDFANAEDASKALSKMNGSELDGRTINVDFAGRKDNSTANPRGRADSRAKNFNDQASPPSDVLFVGNISFEASEDIVSEAFGKFAPVQSVRLPTDPDSGELKGFGYVQFGSIDDATAAYEGMKGASLCGRMIRLDYGKPRADSGGGRGGRGGNGGRGFGGSGGGRGRGGFGDRGGRGGGRGGRGGSTNRGGFGDFQGKKTSF